MSLRKTVRGLAFGAVLAGVVTLAMKMKEEKNKKKAKEISDHAQKTVAKVIAHAQKLGGLTKTAYGQIVDTVLAEYQDVKEISSDELKEMKIELKDGWKEVEAIMKGKTSAKKERAKK
ncbi:hypothetical protein JW899_03755 [Candidatus Uhrbacteria bacterium]|nr:hypothetical protein [Candidatus Uhrbacteria bacterium]